MRNLTSFLTFIAFIFCFNISYSQVTLYSQDFGIAPVTGFPAGWTGSSGTASWTMSSSTASSGYTGASGGINLRSTSATAGSADTLWFSGISTVGYYNISLMYGARKYTYQVNAPVLQWSSDSINWYSVSYTDVASNMTWTLINGGTGIILPSGAEGISNLHLRWIATVDYASSTYRMDDFIITGLPLSTQPVAKLGIVSVNGGMNPDSCSSFNIVVQARDNAGVAVNVTSPVNITLAKVAGNGAGMLSGGSGTIPTGSNSCSINVSYSVSETGVRIEASSGSLIPDTTTALTVLPCNAHLPTCFAWDTASGSTLPYPPGWYPYTMGTPATNGHNAANAGNFDTQGDSLIIKYDSDAGALNYWLYGSGLYYSYRFAVLESSDGISYDTLKVLTNIPNSWTSFSDTANPASRFIKFEFVTRSGYGSIYLDDVCLNKPVNLPPSAVIATPQVICSGSSATLNLTGGYLVAGANWYWYEGSCGGTVLGSGNSIIASPTATTTYYVRAECSYDTSACANATVYVNNSDPLTISAVPPQTCSGVPSTLSTTGSIMVQGSYYAWYEGACGGTQTGTGSSISVTPTALTTYYVRVEGACNTTNCLSVSVSLTTISNPTNPTANPALICQGSSSNLTASASGNDVAWWDAATGGNILGVSPGGNNFPVWPTVNTTYYAESGIYYYVAQTFQYTGSMQSFTVPAGISSLTIDATGASGGQHDTAYGAGGLGGRVQTIFSVSPGMLLNIFVGGQGNDTTAGWNGGGCGTGCTTGYYGGGGGGSSDIRINGTGLGDRIIVAGGGGGAAYYTTYPHSNGGAGGGLTGQNGSRNGAGVYSASYCGAGGSQSAGGVQGTGYAGATAGASGTGGSSAVGGGNGGGGGGAGYFGGGAGISSGGGGGGSSYTDAVLTSATTHTQGFRNGDGYVTIYAYSAYCQSARTPVTVEIDSLSQLPSSLGVNPNNICSGITSTLSLSGGSLVGNSEWKWYSFYCGGSFAGSGISITANPLTTSTYYVRAEDQCLTTSCVSVTIDVMDVPAAPAGIYGANNPCHNTSIMYYINPEQGATYTWTSPNGWTGTSTSSSITFTVNSTGGYIHVFGTNTCGSGLPDSIFIDVTANIPAQSSAITGQPEVCKGTMNVYSVTNVPYVDYYWTLPSGWTTTSGNVSTVYTVAGTGTGTITVTTGNGCGNGPSQTFQVISDLQVPANPGAISGRTFVSTGYDATYNVNYTANVVYHWTCPSDWTGTSTSNSVTYIVGSQLGKITVTPSNTCGNGTTSTFTLLGFDNGIADNPNTAGISLKNYPNPFTTVTTIEYSISQPGNVTLIISDVTGREILNIDEGYKLPGTYKKPLTLKSSAGNLECKLKLNNGRVSYFRTLKILKQ